METFIIILLFILGGLIGYYFAKLIPKKNWETVETINVIRTLENQFTNSVISEFALVKIQTTTINDTKYLRGRLVLKNGREKRISLKKIYVSLPNEREKLTKHGYKF